LLDSLRRADSDGASAAVLEAVNAGVAPESIWDAILLAAQEIMLQAPGIVPLHAVTAANALHYIYGAAGDTKTRKLCLLQAAGWIPLYRERSDPGASTLIDRIEPIRPQGDLAEQLVQVLGAVEADRERAAGLTLGYLEAGGSVEALFAATRSLIFLKGSDSHDYKFGAATIEEFERASDPRWRPALAASILAKVPGPGTSDSPLMLRARQAVARGL